MCKKIESKVETVSDNMKYLENRVNVLDSKHNSRNVSSVKRNGHLDDRDDREEHSGLKSKSAYEEMVGGE